jgi:hypothetical protein
VKRDYLEDGDNALPSRREFIRRGAIALGLTAWTVPLVQMARTHGHRPAPTPSPEEIGVQQITASCTTCVVACESITECGTNGILICFCAPSADVYPIAGCLCASEVFCDDATPCSAGCPPGWACAQGCCDVPVCLPPCPADPQLAFAAATASSEASEAPSGKRLTVTGRRV